MFQLNVLNRQKACRIDAKLLKSITLYLLKNLLHIDSATLAVHLVGEKEMALTNQKFLNHEGSTDVVTFDTKEIFSELYGSTNPPALCGELYICLDDAIKQANQFDAIWQSELVRYIVHGVLHLQGYDDLSTAKRKLMKAKENQLLHQLELNFNLGLLGKKHGGKSQRHNPARPTLN